MSAVTRNTFQPKCEASGVVLTRAMPYRHSEHTLRKMAPPINSLSDTKKARKALSSYDQSLQMLSNSLEQICRKSTTDNNTNGRDNTPSVPSPLLSCSPPARPLSHHFKPCTKIEGASIDQSKSAHLLRTLPKESSTDNIQIRVKHEETGDKLNEDLNKIISSSPVINYTEDSPIVILRKKITDAHEFLRTKFRLKIDTCKYPKDGSTNFYVVVNKTRLIKVIHVSSKPPSEDTTQQDDNTTTPQVHTTSHHHPSVHADSFEESDDPVNIYTVLHSSTIPNSVRLERLLGSFIDGPCIYIRPSSMATAEYSNIKLMSIPILHLNETALRLSLSLKVPSEIPTENIEVKRVDDKLTIKGRGHHILSSDLTGHDSVLESAFKVNVELPEDTDGRSLVAYVTSRRMLVVEGDLLSTSRRMTCRF